MRTISKRTNGNIFTAAAFLLLALALCGPAEVRAQWTTTECGANNVCSTNTGSVGVGTGTSAPAGKLDVKGDTSDSTSSSLNIRNSSNTSLLFTRNDGNIGIGTNSPGARLSVEGTGYVVAQAASPFYAGFQVRASDYATNGGYLLFGKQTGTGTYALMQSGDNGQYRALSINPFGGNVGIGTSGPSFKLDVAGQVRSSSGGFVFPDNTTQTTALVFGSAAGTAVQGNTTLTLTAGAGMSGGGTATLGGGGTLTLTNSDRGSSQNIFKSVGNAAGAAQFSAGSNADTLRFEGTGGTTISFDSANRKVVINSSSASPSGWTDAGSSVSLTNGAARVGIGTSSPGAALDVRGSIALDGTVPAAHAASNYSSLWLKNNVSLISEVAAGNSVVTLGTNFQRNGGTWSNVSESIPAWSLSMGGGPSYDSFELNHSPSGPYTRTTFLMVNSSGNLGVGTTASPVHKLDVNGNVAIGSAYNASTQVPANGLVVEGGVGIGTSSPNAAYKLDVAGKVRSSSGGFVFPDGTTQATAVSSVTFGSTAGTAVQGNTTLTLTAGTGMSGGGQLTLGAGGSLTLTNNDKGSAQSIFKNVGNAAGAAQFSAGSNADTLRFEGTGGTTVSFDAANKKVVINSTSGASSGWTDAGTSVSLTNSAAKVGIGTSNPQKALDVVGAINATGAITGATISATYQDVAEWVPSTQKLAAGTVVVLDTERINHVVASGRAYDTGVAGVVSAEPGVILGVGGDDKLKVATTGRVRVRVDATRAPIKVGDLLVTSDAEGVAMKSIEVDLGGVRIHRPGTIIGKALEPLASGTGEILVLLSLQ